MLLYITVVVIVLKPSADLVQSLIAAFNDTARTREKGIHFNGAMYNCVRADDNSIYGKKVCYDTLFTNPIHCCCCCFDTCFCVYCTSKVFVISNHCCVSTVHSIMPSIAVPFVLYCTVLYCTVLYCTVLYCTALYCIALYCIVLYCIVLYCIVLYCIVLHCTVLYCTVLYCIVLYCIVLYCIVLQCIVLYCIVLCIFFSSHADE